MGSRIILEGMIQSETGDCGKCNPMLLFYHFHLLNRLTQMRLDEKLCVIVSVTSVSFFFVFVYLVVALL